MTRKLLYATFSGAGAAVLALVLWFVGALERLERVTWDGRVRWFAQPAITTPQIKLILLDESSIDWGREVMALSWPWPRELYAPLIDFCRRGHARVVAFDVLFLDPSPLDAAQDEALGAAIRRGPPFVGALFLGETTGIRTHWPAYAPRPEWNITGLDTWLEAGPRKGIDMPTASFPIPEVATNASLLADVKGDQDSDSIIRRGHLFRRFDGQVAPSMALASYLLSRNTAGTGYELKVREGRVDVEGHSIPIDEHGRAILHYRGPPGTYERFTAAQIIRSEIQLREGNEPDIEPDVFQGAYVLFGFSAVGLLDLRPTPLSAVTPGVEVHATLLDNLLASDSFAPAPDFLVALVVLMLALLAATAVLMSKWAWHSVLAFVVFLPLPVAVGCLGYLSGYWWPIAVGELGVALALVTGVVINYATEGRQKAFIKKAFGHYLSRKVRDQILEDPSRLKLGGERRELTIFFSDLQGFSTIAETMEPERLTALLNAYLTDMTDIILEEDGTLDKYEGDAIIAFWNAPLDQPDHALRACRAALRCQRKLDERRAEFKEWTGAELRMRIGINTGDVVVGNLGSSERFDYTVLGDAANLAARLEGANKALGTYTMVAESTWRKCGDGMVGRELGRLRVVGREAPVRVFELVGFAGESKPDYVEAFERGLLLCYAGKWQEAVQVFEQYQEDAVAQRYAVRCREVVRDSWKTWDGVWNLTEK